MPFSPVTLIRTPWSVSALQGALECPFRFSQERAPYQKKKPEANSAFKIGKAVHQALEFALRDRSVKVALQAAAYDQKLTTPEIEELLSYAHNIESFINRIKSYNQSHNTDKMLIEEHFALTTDYKPTDYWNKDKNVFLRGIWDMAICQGSRVLIIDHKSGEPKPMTEHETQLSIYAVTAAFMLPSVSLVQTAIHHVQSEEITYQPAVSREHVQHTLVPWFETYVEKAAQAVQSAEARKNRNCRYCNYVTTCPAR
jgi:ATP-dependent exoDNAse (exonuclease V) beta subunit